MKGSELQNRIENQKTEALNLARELIQSSDDLTRFGRIYSETGNPKFKNYFYKIGEIRDGKIPHPENYNFAYWHFVLSGKIIPEYNGDRYSINEKMLALGCTDQERDTLASAKKYSDDLMNLEARVFNATQGLFLDADNNYTVTGTPNAQLAQSILTGQEYQKYKEIIMSNTEVFFTLVNQRTSMELNKIRTNNQNILIMIIVMVLCTVLMFIMLFYYLYRKITLPLQVLKSGIQHIKDGDYSHYIDIHSQDEIGALAAAFNSMTEEVNERNAELVALFDKLSKLNQKISSQNRALNESAIVSTIHKDGIIKNVNNNFCEITKYRRSELIGRNISLLNSNYHDAHFWQDMHETINKGKIWRGVIKNKTKNNDFYWVDTVISSIEDKNGHLIQFLSIQFDVTERINTEQAVIETEEKNRLILESSSHGIFGTDILGNIRFVNSMVEKLLGYSREDLIGKNAHIFLQHEHATSKIFPESKCPIIQALQEGKTNQVDDEFFIKKDGTPLPVDYIVAPIIEGQKISGSVITFSDITHRLETEAEIKKLHSAIEQSPISIVITDQEGTIKYVNPAFTKICGYTLKEAIGQNPRILKSGIHQDNFYKDLWQDISSGKIWRGEIINRKKNGLKYWERAIIAPVTDKAGNITDYIGIKSDITEQKIIEDKIKANEIQLRTLVDTIPGAVYRCVLDEFWTMVYISKEVEILTGYPYTDFLNNKQRSYSSIIHPDDAGYVDREIKTALKENRSFEIEYRIIHKNGKSVWVFEKGQAEDNEENGDQYLDGTILDITHRKKMEEDLIKAKEKAEEATEAKGNFLANMSHEIRTPMNAVIGFNHLLQKTDLNMRQKDYARKIERSAHNLLDIINDILDFSKIEAGKIELEQIDFNLSDVLDNLTNMMNIKAQGKDIEIIMAQNRDIPVFLVGDPLRLGQILVNLATNAIKFTEKGEIEVKVECLEKVKNKVKLRFSVRDTGIGMTQKHIGKLFKEFQQADSSITRKYGGTGLGLTICKRLVTLLGGDIGVNSIINEGSTFYFSAEFEISEKSDKSNREIPMELQGMQILIVDDNETVLRVLTDYCERFGFDVKKATSGLEALNILKNNGKIDLVLIDWRMKDMDGIEVSRQIYANTTIHHKPKIIMVTAYGREPIMQQAEHLGLDGFLIKPVSQSLLLDTIVDVFGLSVKSSSAVKSRQKKIVDADRIKNVHILLVEDNEINQQVAVELLESEGINVSVAKNGQVAVDMIETKENPFDLVLMDLQMPVMDGYSATKIIRKNNPFHSLPIIAMTADAMSGVKPKTLEAGMNDFITKPIHVDEFYNIVVKWLKNNPEDIQSSGNKSTEDINEIPENIDIVIPDITGIDQVTGLKRMAGNRALFIRILKQFADENRDFCNRIKKVLSEKNNKQAEQLVHAFKGVSGNIGADEIHFLIKHLEMMIKESPEDSKAINRQIEKLCTQLQATMDDINQKLVTEPCKSQKTKPGKLNTRQIKLMFDELEKSLDEFDAQSADIYQKINEKLINHGYDVDLLELEKNIFSYDFEHALDTLIRLRTKLQIK